MGNPAIAAQDLDAEENLLGAMMMAPRAIIAAADKGVKPEHFFRPSHGLICRAIFDLDANGKSADTISVCDWLRQQGHLEEVGGPTVIHTLAQIVAATTNAGRYAEIVVDQAAVRRLQRAAVQIQEIAAGPGSALEKAASADAAMAEALEQAQSQDLQDIGDAMKSAFAELEAAYESKTPKTGLKTGFNKLDEMTNGMMPGQLWILAARPGLGKSTLAQNIAENVASRGGRVGIFSFEMAADEIAKRMAASVGGIPHDKLRTGQFTPDEYERFKKAWKEVAALPIAIEDREVATMAAVRAKSRRMQRAKGLKLLVVDYIQLMIGSSKVESRQNEVAQISRGLKMLARELEIPVLAISQLNRGVEMRENKRPNLSDLRDSGAIEQDADLVAFLYRESYYKPGTENNDAEVIVAKQRSGSTGTVTLGWIGKRCKFTNLGRTPFQQPATNPSEVF